MCSSSKEIKPKIMRAFGIYTCFIFLCHSGIISGQRFTFGEFSGINFSNVHGKITTNKWESKPGASIGLTAQYRLGKSFYFQSELNYLTYYYQVKNYVKNIYELSTDETSLYIVPVYYPPKQQSWDFTFLRLPFLIKYQTPTRLQLGLGVGAFYSFLLNSAEKKSSGSQNYTMG